MKFSDKLHELTKALANASLQITSAKDLVATARKAECALEDAQKNYLSLFNQLKELIARTEACDTFAGNTIDSSIDILELTVRTSNCLKKRNVNTIHDLISLSDDKLLCVPNLGRSSLNELKDALAGIGFSFKKNN